MTINTPAIQNNFPTQLELQNISLIAKTAHLSSMYAGVGGEAKIMMILLAAKELGVGPCQALNGGIWSIQGKIEISARLMNGLIRRAGHSIKIVTSTDMECRLLGTRTDGDSFECSFTMEDAHKAGLASGNVWKKYPADMLYNRCMSRLGRRLFSDVIGQAYIEGEISDAKAVERLEQVECEDVTKPAESPIENNLPPSCTISTPPKQELANDRINEESLKILMETLQLVDDTCATNALKFIKDRYRTTNYFELPQEAFEVCMNCFNRNIEMNKQKAVQNENSST